MSEICERCGHCVWGVVDGLCPDCTDDLKPDKKHEAEFESGYEKGVRDMWVIQKDYCKKLQCGYVRPDIDQNCENGYFCTFDNCPIAEKLLKAVVK